MSGMSEIGAIQPGVTPAAARPTSQRPDHQTPRDTQVLRDVGEAALRLIQTVTEIDSEMGANLNIVE